MTRLVITQGDPAGIGPELIWRLAADGRLGPGDCVVAGRDTLRELARTLGTHWARTGLAAVEPLVDGDLGGRVGQFAALERGVDRILAASGPQRPGLVTAPIDKAAARAEGLTHPGHTEYLAARAGTERFAMLMAGDALRVALATIHLPLREVAEALSGAAIETVGALLAAGLRRDFDVATPRVGVLGLNPHAGEGGLLGREEREVITPAIAALQAWARASGIPATFVGPLPADTAFHYHRAGELDGLVAMYHDQGLGPFKLAHFYDGVNVTLGLPFVRTSPDHGTAKDIAGRGLARVDSMAAAVDLARAMVRRRTSAARADA